jgi:hypothetical protein
VADALGDIVVDSAAESFRHGRPPKVWRRSIQWGV